MTCIPESFENVDPLPGQEKSCYCVYDIESTTVWHDYIYEKKVYWRNVKIAQETAAAEAAAAAEEERLRLLAE